MGTPTNDAAAGQGAAAGKAKPANTDGPKSTGITLTDGAGNQLRLIAVRRKSGGASTYMTQRLKGEDGKFTSKSGTAPGLGDHADMAAARAAIDQASKDAQAKGWSARQGGGAVRAKVIAFNEIPAAKKAPAASKAK